MKKKALLNIEIIVTVLFIIMLVTLSVRKVIILKQEAQRGLSMKNQAALRDAVAVYRGDNAGRCPADISILVPDYIDAIPLAYDENGSASNKVKNGAYPQSFDGKGGWIYTIEGDKDQLCKIFPNTK
jgi:hypothetical protein